eukprot:1513371-Rhodomonas_salina.1
MAQHARRRVAELTMGGYILAGLITSRMSPNPSCRPEKRKTREQKRKRKKEKKGIEKKKSDHAFNGLACPGFELPSGGEREEEYTQDISGLGSRV